MKPSNYLKDKVPFLLFDLLLLASTALLFYLLGVGSMIVIFFEAIQHPKSMLNNIFILYINTKQLYIYNIIFTNISGYIQLVVL